MHMRAVLFWVLGWWAAVACAQPVPEMNMKALYLFNFMRYVDWPNADPEGERVRLCVYGQDPIGPALDTIDGKPLGGGRQVTVVRTRSLAGLRSCRLLYVADAEAGDMPKVMAAVRGQPVLVVAESPLARESAAIIWSLQHSRLVFDVNLKAVRQADLRMSSKLLRLARTVEE